MIFSLVFFPPSLFLIRVPFSPNPVESGFHLNYSTGAALVRVTSELLSPSLASGNPGAGFPPFTTVLQILCAVLISLIFHHWSAPGFSPQE